MWDQYPYSIEGSLFRLQIILFPSKVVTCHDHIRHDALVILHGNYIPTHVRMKQGTSTISPQIFIGSCCFSYEDYTPIVGYADLVGYWCRACYLSP